MKANMIANMQMAMAGTKQKKKSAARKTKLENFFSAAREGLIEL